MIDLTKCHLSGGDALDMYGDWRTPTCIVSDGAVGSGQFDGDPWCEDGLADWYRPHVIEWSRLCGTSTTLWFWNTELGWAKVHPLLEDNGWRYVRCNIWDRGAENVSGSPCQSQYPCSSEVCVQYVRDGSRVKRWLRSEWLRSGLPLGEANDACGVRNAATRKYLTLDDAFYFPPDPMFLKLRGHADSHGDPAGRPYFRSIPGLSGEVGDSLDPYRPKFHGQDGLSNVWRCAPPRGSERMRRSDGRMFGWGQKPLELMELIVRSSTDPGDAVWEPFGGLFTASLAACSLGREAYGAESNPDCFALGCERVRLASEEARQLELF